MFYKTVPINYFSIYVNTHVYVYNKAFLVFVTHFTLYKTHPFYILLT